MSMGVFVLDKGGNGANTLAAGKQEYIDIFLKGCRQAVEISKRTNGKLTTMVPGDFQRNLPIGIQTANVIEALRRGAEILETHNIVMVLEALSDTPNLFLRTSDQTYEICKAVNSPSCKILYDIYHMQRNEGDKSTLAVFALAWKRQVGIDLESAESFVRNPADLPGLAERIFSERELAAWRALPASESNTAAFLRGWTRKEACLKAAGLRLDDMASIETGFDQVSAPGEILISSVEPSATIRLKIYDLPLLAAQAPAACALAVETN